MDVAWSAILEISEKGLTYLPEGRDDANYQALPLTKEYLALKWDENLILNRKVKERMTDMFTSDTVKGALLKLSVDKRIEFLLAEIPRRIAARDMEKALKLSELALSWKPDAVFLFYKGRIMFDFSNRPGGLSYMRRAMADVPFSGSLKNDDLSFYVNALFLMGGQTAEGEACQYLLDLSKRGFQITHEMADKFVRYSLSARNYDDVLDFASEIGSDETSHLVTKEVSRLFDTQFIGRYAPRLDRIVRRMIASTAIPDDEKRLYKDLNEDLKSVKKFK
jgi:hypothetical protein